MERKNSAAERSNSSSEITYETSEHTFEAVLTPAYKIEPDPFSLDEGKGSSRLLSVKLNGKEIHSLASKDSVKESIRISLKDVIVGKNEIFIEASPPSDSDFTGYALKLTVLRNSNLEAEKIFWGENGQSISGSLLFDSTHEEEDGHDH
ncbi:MAG: hypothetical protein ACYTFY_11575 [Planctomycetota bacterium]